MESKFATIGLTTMKTQRPGLVLNNRGESIKISLDHSVSLHRVSVFDSDIVITVNEITSQGAVRLGIHVPHLFSTVQLNKNILQQIGLNCLCLSRSVGTSVVIRKRNEVSRSDALFDLRQNGIYVSNTTQSLLKAGYKTGASLAFHATEAIWKIVRLELTLLRGITK